MKQNRQKTATSQIPVSKKCCSETYTWLLSREVTFLLPLPVAMQQGTTDHQEEKSAYCTKSGWESDILERAIVRGRKEKEGVIEWGKGWVMSSVWGSKPFQEAKTNQTWVAKRKERRNKNVFDSKTTICGDSCKKPWLTILSLRTSLRLLAPRSHDKYSSKSRKRQPEHGLTATGRQ